MPGTPHTAQLICDTDPNVMSDIASAPTLPVAKDAAKQNYEKKFNANRNWQSKWKTFEKLLADSSYKTS